MRLPCTIQARRWDTLVDALETGKGDAMIASMRATPPLRERLAFTAPLLSDAGALRRAQGFSRRARSTPPRSPARRSASSATARTRNILAQFFPEAKRESYDDFAALHRGLKAGEIDLAFADGLTLAIWLGGEDAGDCCAFRGGPFLESRYFGEGVAIAVRKDDAGLAPRARLRARPGLGQRAICGDFPQIFPVVVLLSALCRAAS